MKFVFAFVAAVLMMLPLEAQSFNGVHTNNVTEPEPELLFHAAAPGIIVMPRSDMSQMIMAYDVTFIPREGQVYVRWGKLDENGEGEGLWTKWRECGDDEVLTFTTAGRYVLEAHAEAAGKENSCTIKATFRVDYIGMTLAPGIKMLPYEQRGYNVSLTSVYGDPVYYRWKRAEDDVWNEWRLYTEVVPFTEVGKYVLDARCENDPLSVYLEVPSIEYHLTGDVDFNGAIDINDVTALIDMLLSNTTVVTGDVNQDGTIDINDVTSLIDKLLNLN